MLFKFVLGQEVAVCARLMKQPAIIIERARTGEADGGRHID